MFFFFSKIIDKGVSYTNIKTNIVKKSQLQIFNTLSVEAGSTL